MANKPMWDWMDKHEGKKVGSSHAAMEKEKVRQGYGKAKSKALAKKHPKAGELARLQKKHGHSDEGTARFKKWYGMK